MNTESNAPQPNELNMMEPPLSSVSSVTLMFDSSDSLLWRPGNEHLANSNNNLKLENHNIVETIQNEEKRKLKASESENFAVNTNSNNGRTNSLGERLQNLTAKYGKLGEFNKDHGLTCSSTSHLPVQDTQSSNKNYYPLLYCSPKQNDLQSGSQVGDMERTNDINNQNTLNFLKASQSNNKIKTLQLIDIDTDSHVKNVKSHCDCYSTENHNNRLKPSSLNLEKGPYKPDHQSSCQIQARNYFLKVVQEQNQQILYLQSIIEKLQSEQNQFGNNQYVCSMCICKTSAQKTVGTQTCFSDAILKTSTVATNTEISWNDIFPPDRINICRQDGSPKYLQKLNAFRQTGFSEIPQESKVCRQTSLPKDLQESSICRQPGFPINLQESSNCKLDVDLVSTQGLYNKPQVNLQNEYRYKFNNPHTDHIDELRSRCNKIHLGHGDELKCKCSKPCTNHNNDCSSKCHNLHVNLKDEYKYRYNKSPLNHEDNCKPIYHKPEHCNDTQRLKSPDPGSANQVLQRNELYPRNVQINRGDDPAEQSSSNFLENLDNFDYCQDSQEEEDHEETYYTPSPVTEKSTALYNDRRQLDDQRAFNFEDDCQEDPLQHRQGQTFYNNVLINLQQVIHSPKDTKLQDRNNKRNPMNAPASRMPEPPRVIYQHQQAITNSINQDLHQYGISFLDSATLQNKSSFRRMGEFCPSEQRPMDTESYLDDLRNGRQIVYSRVDYIANQPGSSSYNDRRPGLSRRLNGANWKQKAEYSYARKQFCENYAREDD